jgi:glycosyltransferase involved in cell wall biosynthesis
MTISTNSDLQHSPAVSVVIAAYNSVRYIAQALDSLKAQTFSDFEVIVVNDGSSDRKELEQILQLHPLPVIYLSQENKGVSAARNAAIRIARGQFYAQLDADDQWTPDYLETQLGILKDNPDVALVYPNATIIGDEGEVGGLFMDGSPSEGEVSFDTLVRQQCVVMTCVTARMSAIRAAGMFDESIRSCEDFELWVRIVKNGDRIVYHRKPLALYRRHEGSLSSDRIWMIRNLIAVFDKFGTTLKLTPTERETLNEERARGQAVLNLFEGKRALANRQGNEALVHFSKAQAHMRSSKLALVIFFLRRAPRLVIWISALRERMLAKQSQHQLSGIDKPRERNVSPEGYSCDSM